MSVPLSVGIFEEEYCIRELYDGTERALLATKSQEYRTILPGYPKNPARVINL